MSSATVEPGSASRQCSIAAITSPVIVEPALPEQVVGLVDAARGRVLDRQERQVGLAGEHRLGGAAEGLAAGEEHAAGAAGILALRREVTVRTLRSLIGDAQRCGLERAHERLLVRHGHVQDDAIEPLDLVRVEPLLHRRLPQAQQQTVLARRIAERPGAAELRLGDAFDQVHPLAQQPQQPLVDPFERLAQPLEVAGQARFDPARRSCGQTPRFAPP